VVRLHRRHFRHIEVELLAAASAAWALGRWGFALAFALRLRRPLLRLRRGGLGHLRLWTPAWGCGCLLGIRRRLALRLRRAGLRLRRCLLLLCTLPRLAESLRRNSGGQEHDTNRANLEQRSHCFSCTEIRKF
jgi:hypothetical protein